MINPSEWHNFIANIYIILMYSYRFKKIRNQTQKYLQEFANDNLILTLLNHNQKCTQQITKYHFKKAAKLIAQIKLDYENIEKNREKNIIKSLSLNTEAYYFQKQNDYNQALQCILQAEEIEVINASNPIEVARTKLNKSVILSHLGKNEQAIQLGKTALQLLKKEKKKATIRIDSELQKNQFKFYELIISSFYNIAAELSHLSEINQARNVFKEGFIISNKILGPKHKLTLILHEIIKQQKHSISKQKKTQNGYGRQQDIRHSNLITKLDSFNLNNNNLSSVMSKEQQLKKIYYKKKKSVSLSEKNKKQRPNYNYYLKSLEKLKNFDGNKKISAQKHRNHTDTSQNRNNISQIKKQYTNSYDSKSYQQKMYNQRIKDIILNNKHSNKNNPFNHANKSLDIFYESPPNKTVELIPLFPNKQPQRKAPTETIPQIEQSKESCQLI